MLNNKKPFERFTYKEFINKYKYKSEYFTSRLGFFERILIFKKTFEWEVDKYFSKKENVFSTFWIDLKKAFCNLYLDIWFYFKPFFKDIILLLLHLSPLLDKAYDQIMELMINPKSIHKMDRSTRIIFELICWAMLIALFSLLYFFGIR